MLGPDGVKGVVSEREGDRVAVAEGHAVGQAGSFGEECPDPAVILGQIEDRHAAVALGDECARGAAEAAADIEHRHARQHVGQIHQIEGRLPRADVKLINWGEVGRGGMRGILAREA